MIIWMMAGLLLVGTVVLGYTQGAVRTGISALGLLLGMLLAMPLSPIVQPMVARVGGTQIHAMFLAPVVVLMVFVIVSKVIAQAVHLKVDTYYRYNVPEYVFALYQRTNERFGAALGAISALLYLIFICTVICVLGYPVYQLSSEEKDSPAWRWLVKAVEAVKTTKMDRVVAAFNPAPQSYYQACDLLGMLYHNPLLLGRLANYPPLMVMEDREEFKAIANDLELIERIQQYPPLPFQQIIGEPKIQAVVTNKEILTAVLKLDLKDLSNYLQTGVSEKYGDEKLVGRWEYNHGASLAAMLRADPKLTNVRRRMIVMAYDAMMKDAWITAHYNNQIVLRIKGTNDVVNVIRGTWTKNDPLSYTVEWSGGADWSGKLAIKRDRLELKKGEFLVLFDAAR